MDNLTGQ